MARAVIEQDKLLADLRADAVSVPALLRALKPEQLERGAYEQGWTVRDLVAHLASIEWTYPRLLERAAQPPATEPPAESSDSGGPGEAGSGMDRYNARQVEKRRETPMVDLIAEFSANRQATIDAVAAADPALLRRRSSRTAAHADPSLRCCVSSRSSTCVATSQTSTALTR